MIRYYCTKDREELIELMQLNIPHYFALSELEDFITYLDKNVEDYFVVEDSAKIIACGGINYFPYQRQARFSWDVVHPDQHGKGIGKKLARHRMDHIRQKTGIDLAVVRTSQMAYGFYQKMGFELKKIEKNYWEEGFDLYLMTQEVNKKPLSKK